MLREAAAVRSAGLLRGFATVRREEFVGPGPWKILVPPDFFTYHDTPDDDPRRLYANVLVAVDPARRLNNGEPAALARWLDALELAEGECLLHIGCGVGYYTAVVAEAVGPGGRVLALDVDAALAHRARANLRIMSWVSVECGDGGALEPESFDAIFVNAGVTEIPEGWLDALRHGGRLIVPLTVGMPGFQAGIGEMLLVTRSAGGYSARFNSLVGIFHCAVGRPGANEHALQAALGRGDSAAVRSLRRDVHASEPECWLHEARYCLSRRESA